MKFRNLNFFKKFIQKRIGIKNIDYNGILLTLVLLLFIFSFSINIIRGISNAHNNYQIYITEISNYQNLKERNKNLKDDLEYYNSDEFKQIFLRESVLLADPDSKIFNTRSKPNFIQERKYYFNLENYSKSYFWEVIIKKYLTSF